MTLPKHGARKCGATKQDGSPCGMTAGYGTNHVGWGRCRWHFGCTPTVSKAAISEKVRTMATEACSMLNLDVDYSHVAPETALLEECRRSYGIVAWFDQQIAAKTPDDLAVLMYNDETAALQQEISIWYKIYEQERAHLARVCKMAIDAGVAVAHLALLETQAKDLARAIQAVLDGLGLNEQQRDLAPQLLRSALTAIPVVGIEKEPA